MATVQHSTLTTSDLHEPKGVSTASSGDVYIADGAGSGAWAEVAGFEYGNIFTEESDAVTIGSIGTTAQTLAFAQNGPASGVTADSANNRLTISKGGVYWVMLTANFSTTSSGSSGLYEFKVQDDAVDTKMAAAREMSGANDTGSASTGAIIQFGAGSQITVTVESDNGSNTDSIDVYALKLTVVLLKEV